MISAMLEVAMRHALDGRFVFPCAKKKPLVPHGFKTASLHPEDLSRWWTKWPNAQVGLPTGNVNRLFVLDVDGSQARAYIEKMQLPDTFTVETSPGHRQLWFHQPDGVTTKCTAGVLAPELDTRGDGGYVIAPGSVHHETGQPYRALNDLPWAEMPPQLLQAVNGNGAGSIPADAIPQGRRHQTMLSMAGALRARGLAPASVLAALMAVNEQRCVPPLLIAELEKLAAYVGTKPAGFRGTSMETSAEVVLECFAAVKPEYLRWVWPRRIPLGKLTLFCGDPGQGKSLASIDLGARVSRGASFPDGAPAEAGDVVFLSAEDDPADTQVHRLIAAGANMARVHRVKAVKVTLADGATAESHFNLARDLEKLEEALAKMPGVQLLVIDPLTAYLGRIDSHKDAEVRGLLTPLAGLAARRRVAVVSIMHLKKTETSALLRVSGSIGFVAAARVVWGFGDDPDVPGSHVMVAVKNNLAPMGDALAYGIEAEGDVPRIVWQEGALQVDANAVLSGAPRARAEPDALEVTIDYLHDLLIDGPRLVKEIQSEARRDGFSWRTLRRAKAKLGVVAAKNSLTGGWSWRLPPKVAKNKSWPPSKKAKDL